VLFKAERDEDVICCGCKRTGTRPFCDGAHSNLPGGYLTDGPDSADNRKVASVVPGAGPIVKLDGQCYVFSTARAALISRDAMRYCQVVTPALGALFQSQFYAEIAGGSSPVLAAGGRCYAEAKRRGVLTTNQPGATGEVAALARDLGARARDEDSLQHHPNGGAWPPPDSSPRSG